MESLGNIGDRQILYTNIRTDQNWSNVLPTDNWLVFTIAGRFSSLTEDIFDEEIVDRAIQDETRTGKPYDYELSPLTTSQQKELKII